MTARTLRLFVYGTLQPQAGTAMGDWISARLVGIEPASAPGRLFAIGSEGGWFPALLPARGACRLRGTLCELRLKPGELGRLDRYEGREYRRVTAPVRTASGRRGAAQLYLWRAPLPSGAPMIGGGNFLDWLRTGRRRPFSGT
ncbi:gamma-glutamylcyclotransferase family protein [Novosphingobium sp. AP12]|uniref:gamma-glutamylcyclotransferase family protein n=1 Tax=Novosphingobium sp. AP12 TaxID=1144305 RepID=UPI000271E7EC|nr:gamma-glutamylcyclotransferase family protein [Novosphingobium sp. AP12]EJL21794.1 hypothetical protein PMI02_04975 [Novosphingobium sp. AP12]